MLDPATQSVVHARPRAFAWPLVRKLCMVSIALLTLYSSVRLLQIFALLPEIAAARRATPGFSMLASELSRLRAKDAPPAQQQDPAALHVVPVSREPHVFPESRTIAARVTGKTLPGAKVTALVGLHKIDGSADKTGLVEVPIEVSEFQDFIHVITLGSADARDGVDLALPWKPSIWSGIAPVVDFAQLETGSNRVWLAGRASGWQLYTQAPGDEGRRAISQRGAFFDALLPLSADNTVSLMAAADGREEVPVPVGASLSEVTQLPLRRSLAVSFEHGVAVFVIEISLPDEHPAFRALATGQIDAPRFVWALWDVWLWSSTTAAPIIERSAGLGKVRVHGRKDAAVELLQFAGSYEPPGSEAAPSQQLLRSADDTITVQFGAVQPSWFDAPLPSTLDHDHARWQGPLPVPQGIRFGLRLPDDVLAELRRKELERATAAQPVAAEQAPSLPSGAAAKAERKRTMQDWVSTDNGTSQEFVLAGIWRALVWSSPVLAFALLLWRARSTRRRSWPPVAAALIVIAGYMAWSSVVSNLLNSACDFWLWHWQFSISEGLGQRATVIQLNAGTHAELLILFALAAFAPLYAAAIEHTYVGATRKPAASRFAWAGNLGFVLQVVWLAVTLAALLKVNEFARLPFGSQPGPLELWVYEWLELPEGWQACAERLIRDDDALSLIQAVLYTLALLVFGWRGLAFGVAWLALLCRLYVEPFGVLSKLSDGTLQPTLQAVTGWLRSIPWSSALPIATVLALPLLIQLLRRLLPILSARSASWPRAVGLVLLLSSISLAFVPVWLALLALGAYLLAALLGVALRGARRLPAVAALRKRAALKPASQLMATLVILGLAWPTPVAGDQLTWSSLFHLLSALRGFAVLISIAFFLLLLEDYCNRRADLRAPFEPRVLLAGAVLFAFYISSTLGTWSYVPVPTVIAWLMARYWLLREAPRDPVSGTPEQRRAQIADALAAAKARARLEAVERALEKKVSAGELMPEELEKRLEAYRSFYESKIAPSPASEPKRFLPFSHSEDSPWRTGWQFVRMGALLSTPALVITLYEYLPASTVSGAYPAAELSNWLLRTTANWLLIGFFFGFFFNHIYGGNGLKKGLALWVALAVPKLALQLMRATPLVALRPFGMWATLTFAFCTLLGGIADYRTMRAHGFKFRDLLVVHELPWLSVYASSLAAALVSAAVTLLSGKFGEIAKLFISDIGPSAGH